MKNDIDYQKFSNWLHEENKEGDYSLFEKIVHPIQWKTGTDIYKFISETETIECWDDNNNGPYNVEVTAEELNQIIYDDFASFTRYSPNRDVTLGLAMYIHEEDELEKVISIGPPISCDEKGNPLSGIITEANLLWTVHTNGELTKEEIEKVIDEISGQCSDGWGEGFCATPIRIVDVTRRVYYSPSDEIRLLK